MLPHLHTDEFIAHSGHRAISRCRMLNYSSNEKEKKLLILAHLLITASSAYHAPSPDRKTLILGHGFVHSNVESCASVRMLAVLRPRLVLEVAQPSRTPSRFHPQRRGLRRSTFCRLPSPLCGRTSSGRLFVKMSQY